MTIVCPGPWPWLTLDLNHSPKLALSALPRPLTLALTLALAVAKDKQLRGERRFRQIENVEPQLAGKVTDMLFWPLDRAACSEGTLERCLEVPSKVPTGSSASSFGSLVILTVAAVSCALFVPLPALGLRQRVR